MRCGNRVDIIPLNSALHKSWGNQIVAGIKKIKRYANRRLYDAETSKTITLEDVAEGIIHGQEIQVIDNITGEDITSRILGQTFLKIIMDLPNRAFSNFLLTALIREVSTNLSDLFARLVQGGIGAKALTLDKLNTIVEAMIDQGHLHISERGHYQDEILIQMQTQDSRLESRVREGLGVLRTSLEAQPDTRMGELSDKLEEMARLIKEIQQR